MGTRGLSVLAVGNSAAVNTDVQVFLNTHSAFPLDMCPEVQLLPTVALLFIIEMGDDWSCG